MEIDLSDRTDEDLREDRDALLWEVAFGEQCDAIIANLASNDLKVRAATTQRIVEHAEVSRESTAGTQPVGGDLLPVLRLVRAVAVGYSWEATRSESDRRRELSRDQPPGRFRSCTTK